METLLTFIAAAALAIFLVVMWFWWQRKTLERALVKYCKETGERVEIRSIWFPPPKYWLKNSKGTVWGRIRRADGRKQWCRYNKRDDEPIQFLER